MARVAEMGGNSQPEIENAEPEITLGSEFERGIDDMECTHADGDGARVGEASTRTSSSDLFVISQSPAVMKEEDSNPGVAVQSSPIEVSKDLAEAHSRFSPVYWMNQLLSVLACRRHSSAINPWSLLLSSGAKTLSAGLYLFDFVSNILVLRQYYTLSQRRIFSGYEASDHFLMVPFIVCLGFMIFDAVVAVVVFKLKLRPEENPLRSAFLLPIVQFQRFVVGIFKTGSCASGSEMTESLETEALFALTSAIETGPQLILQITVISEFVSGIPPILLISVIASILSASYNAGRAIMYQMSKRWTLALNFSGIVGGIYTFGAIMLRCIATVSLILQFGEKFYDTTNIISQTLYFGGGICLMYVIGVLIVLLSKEENINMCSWTTQVEILIITYISFTIGPLYTIIENNGENNSSSRSRSFNPNFTFCMRLGLAIGINMLPDVLLLLLLHLPISHIHPFCKPGTTQNAYKYTPNFNFILKSCHQFIGYVTAGLVLSILPCIILPYLVNVGTREQCESHSHKVSIDTTTIVEDRGQSSNLEGLEIVLCSRELDVER